MYSRMHCSQLRTPLREHSARGRAHSASATSSRTPGCSSTTHTPIPRRPPMVCGNNRNVLRMLRSSRTSTSCMLLRRCTTSRRLPTPLLTLNQCNINTSISISTSLTRNLPKLRPRRILITPTPMPTLTLIPTPSPHTSASPRTLTLTRTRSSPPPPKPSTRPYTQKGCARQQARTRSCGICPDTTRGGQCSSSRPYLQLRLQLRPRISYPRTSHNHSHSHNR